MQINGWGKKPTCGNSALGNTIEIISETAFYATPFSREYVKE